MNAKVSVFFISIEAIIYLLLCNLRDCTFKSEKYENSLNVFASSITESIFWRKKVESSA